MTSDQETRPALENVCTGEELLRWYWLKAELVSFARSSGLPTSGSKPELTRRIGHWLDTGDVLAAETKRATSRFDWGKGELEPETVITDNYRNTRNVRAFMLEHAGAAFRFSNEFMAWMREHTGHTLADAVDFWRELDRRKREEGYEEASLPQNQYAQFSRALARAKPGISAAEIRRIWAIKRSRPAPHVYAPGDEEL